MKNKQTILYTLLGIMFGVVIGMMTISSASAVDFKAPTLSEAKQGCHDETKECDCSDCEGTEDCDKCEKCSKAPEASCGESSQSCSF